jgi:hypothetical protein
MLQTAETPLPYEIVGKVSIPGFKYTVEFRRTKGIQAAMTSDGPTRVTQPTAHVVNENGRLRVSGWHDLSEADDRPQMEESALTEVERLRKEKAD